MSNFTSAPSLRSTAKLCRPPRLRSRVRGRERWDVPAILGNIPSATSVKTLLESESGIRRVVVNELTGRVLVEYVPGELTDPIQELLRRALDFGPMSMSEFDALRDSKPPFLPALGAFASAELGCLFLKLLFFGVGCPAVGTAASLVGLAAVCFLHKRSTAVIPMPAAAGRRRAVAEMDRSPTDLG
jgi:hypothetical protein